MKNAYRAASGALALLALAACSGHQDAVNNSATRANDRVLGTDVSGAYPAQRDGTPGNPPGTVGTRAIDRAAGSDISGAYPENKTK